jgi:protein-S-isoprenylcysteine O-methyltransferase Ste14
MMMEKLAVLAFGTACFLAFAWAMLRHFRSDGPMPFGMRLIGAVSLATMAVFTWSVCTERLSQFWLVAPILSAASLASFTWPVYATKNASFAVAFAATKPSLLVVSGPFHYVRHPFYSSYLIFWFATCFATANSVCWVGPAILLTCYTVAARKEEYLMSHGELGAEYASYVSRTGMFFP